jgi:protocatechuate 3,4-dioxygenase beta subunit
MVPLLALLFLLADKPPEPCRLEGLAVNAVTGEPLGKALVVLEDTSGQRDSRPSITTTGPDGRFAMAGIPPGRYHLRAERTGYLGQPRGSVRQTVLTLEPGQRVTDLKLRLTPNGVISGKVLDEDGEPIEGASIVALRYRYNKGVKQLLPDDYAGTNDLGEFRLASLRPGTYVLMASSGHRWGWIDRSAARPEVEKSDVPTFYPGVQDPSAATPVALSAGARMGPLGITMLRLKTARVRGKVQLPDGVSRADVNLFPASGGFGGNYSTSTGDSDGTFEIRGVPFGSYRMQAHCSVGNRQHLWAEQALEVGDNVEGIRLIFGSGTRVTGRVEVDGEAKIDFSRVRIGIECSPSSLNTSAEKDGSIELPEFPFPPRECQVIVSPPDGFYVKSVRFSGTDVTDAGVVIPPAGGSLDIALKPGAGRIEGAVLNEKREPAAGATVVLVPDRRTRYWLFQQTSVDQYGRYSFASVPPGGYKLFAWGEVEEDAWFDPEFMKEHEKRAESVFIDENARKSVELTLIPAP